MVVSRVLDYMQIEWLYFDHGIAELNGLARWPCRHLYRKRSRTAYVIYIPVWWPSPRISRTETLVRRRFERYEDFHSHWNILLASLRTQELPISGLAAAILRLRRRWHIGGFKPMEFGDSWILEETVTSSCILKREIASALVNTSVTKLFQQLNLVLK